MNSTSKHQPDQIDADISAQAREWFVALRDNPTRAQRSVCAKWRQISPEHERAWRAIESVWQATDAPGRALAEKEAQSLAGYLVAMDQHHHRQVVRQRLRSVSSVCLLVLVLTGIWATKPDWLQNLTADHVTAMGERRDVTLADGSTVLLDADTAVSTEITAQKRRVRLLHGSAFFNVTHSNIPFIVETQAGTVSVLGTQFDVRLQGDSGTVTLAQGRVAVTSTGQAQPTILEPGRQVTFNARGVSQPVKVSVNDEMAWHTGRFIFYRARLADVIREVERYRTGKILIANSALADEKVTGSFSLEDSDAALASLQASVGFNLHKLTEYMVVLTP